MKCPLKHVECYRACLTVGGRVVCRARQDEEDESSRRSREEEDSKPFTPVIDVSFTAPSAPEPAPFSGGGGESGGGGASSGWDSGSSDSGSSDSSGGSSD